jgi:hypothetical protein
MLHGLRAQRALLVAALLGARSLRPAFGLVPECTDLPKSSVKVHRLTVDQVTERAATPAEIEDIIAALAGTHSTHPLMAIVDAIDTRVAVEHRVVERPQGYCDTPEAVLFGLGVTRREVFIVHAAAIDACVRAALLTHEAEHNRALGKAIHDFIQQQRPMVAQRLDELKRRSAADPQSAARAFETGLRMLLAAMMKEFKEAKLGEIRGRQRQPPRGVEQRLQWKARRARTDGARRRAMTAARFLTKLEKTPVHPEYNQ